VWPEPKDMTSPGRFGISHIDDINSHTDPVSAQRRTQSTTSEGHVSQKRLFYRLVGWPEGRIANDRGL
jgi:hypothetical protein